MQLLQSLEKHLANLEKEIETMQAGLVSLVVSHVFSVYLVSEMTGFRTRSE